MGATTSDAALPFTDPSWVDGLGPLPDAIRQACEILTLVDSIAVR